MSAAISRAGDFAVVILAARLLDSFDFGAFTVFMVIIGLINALVSGGGDMWLNRFTVARFSQDGRVPRIWIYYIATSGALGAAAMLLGAIAVLATRADILHPGELDNYYFTAALAIAAAVIGGLAETVLALLRSAGRVALFFAIRDIARPILIFVALILIRPDTVDMVIGLTLGVWLSLFMISVLYCYAIRLATFPHSRFTISRWVRLSRHTMLLIGGNLTSRLAAYLDVFVLLEIIGFAAVGEYRAAAQFAIGFMVVQHFVFLGLPWQVHQLKTVAGAKAVDARQRLLLILSLLALCLLTGLSEWILLLLGERFVAMGPIFILFLCLRFSEITWGPQHEILISNGKALEDIKAGLVAIIIWIIAFSILYLFASAIASAICAAAAASFAGQVTRRRALTLAGVGPVYGHPLSAWGPMAITLGIATYALIYL